MAVSVFTNYEREVVAALLASRFSADQIQAVLDEGTFVSFEHTGVGCFLKVKHVLLPEEYSACDEPWLVGRVGDALCGFVVFLSEGELTLNCFGYATESDQWGYVPEDIRELPVQIERMPS